jgi:hypothetical protein
MMQNALRNEIWHIRYSPIRASGSKSLLAPKILPLRFIQDWPSGGNCSIISVFPPAETRFTPGQELDFAWTVRNDSGVTWTAADFDIAFVGGTNMLKRQEETRRDLPYDVLPGNPLSVMIDAVVPSDPGRFTMTSVWFRTSR